MATILLCRLKSIPTLIYNYNLQSQVPRLKHLPLPLTHKFPHINTYLLIDIMRRSQMLGTNLQNKHMEPLQLSANNLIHHTSLPKTEVGLEGK